MLDFIVKYWVQFLFGLVAACITFAIKKYYDIKKREQEQGREDFKDEIIGTINKDLKQLEDHSNDIDKQLQDNIMMLTENIDKLTKGVENIQQQMIVDNVMALKQGVLSMQGKIFKEECRRLLDPEHIITETEYEELIVDHEAYNGLGGNHIGDRLFNSVVEKWRLQMKQSVYDASDE